MKILVIGEGSVGKTSLASQYTSGSFEESQLMTIGANFMLKEYESHKSDQTYRLSIWDTAGQEHFKKIVDGYYKEANGALVVFDITNKESFKGLDFWIKTAKEKAPGIELVLVGNKLDLELDREVPKELAVDKANELGIDYIETSAKTNLHISEAFAIIAETILEKL